MPPFTFDSVFSSRETKGDPTSRLSKPRRSILFKKKKTKSVSFHSSVRFREIPALSQYSPQDIDNLWYTHEDYILMKRNDKIALALHSSSNESDAHSSLNTEPHHCIRGLEHRISGAGRRMDDRFRASSAVLMEQHRQQTIGEHDPQAIAKIYANECHSSCMDAYAMGLKDMEAVQQQPEKAVAATPALDRRMRSLQKYSRKNSSSRRHVAVSPSRIALARAVA